MLAALPFDAAVEVFDEPELTDHRCGIIQRMEQTAVAPLIDAMSADQQADLFRELPDADRSRLLQVVNERERERGCRFCSAIRPTPLPAS